MIIKLRLRKTSIHSLSRWFSRHWPIPLNLLMQYYVSWQQCVKMCHRLPQLLSALACSFFGTEYQTFALNTDDSSSVGSRTRHMPNLEKKMHISSRTKIYLKTSVVREHIWTNITAYHLQIFQLIWFFKRNIYISIQIILKFILISTKSKTSTLPEIMSKRSKFDMWRDITMTKVIVATERPWKTVC